MTRYPLAPLPLHPLPPRPLPGVRWTSAAVLVALGAGTVRAARRLRAIPVLPMTRSLAGLGAGACGWRLFTSRGVEPDAAHLPRRLRVRRPGGAAGTGPAARRSGHGAGAGPAAARRSGGLPAGPARRGAGPVSPRAVSEQVLARAGLDPAEAHSTPAELQALLRRLKQYAPDATGMAVAPALRCGPAAATACRAGRRAPGPGAAPGGRWPPRSSPGWRCWRVWPCARAGGGPPPRGCTGSSRTSPWAGPTHPCARPTCRWPRPPGRCARWAPPCA